MAAKKKTTKTNRPAPRAAAKKKTARKSVAVGSAKKTSTRKPRTPKPKPEDLKPLTPEDLQHFAELLLEKRRELVGDVDHMRNGALESSRENGAGELSNMPIHMADIGTDNYEQEFTLGLIESERKMLMEIDRALAKINEGTYGLCEGTGQPIARSRLEARPEARYSIAYARELEKKQVKPVSASDDSDDLSKDAV